MILSVVCDGPDPFDQALEKAANPSMSLANNPLREDINPKEDLVRKNMRRLREDADAWTDRRHGEAYRAVRSMVLNKGD